MVNNEIKSLYTQASNYQKVSDFNNAKKIYQKLIKKEPDFASAYNNLGVIELESGNFKMAEKYLTQAIEINSKLEEGYYNLGNLNQQLKNHQQAIEFYIKTLFTNPSFHLALSQIYYSSRHLCKWNALKRLSKTISKLPPSIEPPFNCMMRTDDLSRNLLAAKAASDFYSTNTNPFTSQEVFKKTTKKKLYIGYVSNNFYDFPTTHNVVGILENHNKKNFKIIALSFGNKQPDIYTQRVKSAVHQFVDISNLSIVEMVKAIKKEAIDILVDLRGHSIYNLFTIFSHKPAPVIVNYLGFPGTTGSTFHDYIIADKTTIPTNHKKFYSEKIVHLPGTYWPTDNKLGISKSKFKKKDFGLSESTFVFGSLNQTYKIEPDVFRIWIQILRQVPNSILLLYCPNDYTKNNLIKYTKSLRFNIGRLKFLDRLPKHKHLARIRDVVDIALDTKTVNGHTTTTDCLWAGVPVITIQGKHFASRVSASMLNAIGLPELIVKDLKKYESLAIELATNKEKLKSVVNKLKNNKKTHPLFDTEKYTHNLEAVYINMWREYIKST